VVVFGTADDLRFKKYSVHGRHLGSAGWASLNESASPVADGALTVWNTLLLPDGDYEIRLSVEDTLGLIGTALVRVIVDNHAPWADQTAPAIVSVTSGGDVYTTEEEVHLYFPPRAFARDTEVLVMPLARSTMPDTLENGAVRVLPGYEISWGGADLVKPAMLEMSYAGPEALLSDPSSNAQQVPADGTLALYILGADSTWQRVGGTVDASTQHISSPLREPGRYAIYADAGGMLGPSTLSNIAVTPRAFSPRGSFANEEASISFTLGRSGSVTVKIYNRAGRLVHEIASGRPMNAGANLVRWDGRDSNADLVPSGLYFVTIEALGETKSKTVSVVR
jgi:hypothetical protein